MRQALQWIISALLWLAAAVSYAVGFLIGRCAMFALWCWAALLKGYRDGL